LRGLLAEPVNKYTLTMSDSLRNRLFEVKVGAKSFAIDLGATNINRGRDHGIAGYNTFRQKCGLKKVFKFEELADVMSFSSILKLSDVYE
jgi:peroxidase